MCCPPSVLCLSFRMTNDRGKIVREACVENLKDAKAAWEHGASRIELCRNLSFGGTTPLYKTISDCSNNLPVPVFVMIRPRGGDFVYSAEEIEIMKADIQRCRELGVPGIVLGILTTENKIDIERTRQLVEFAAPMQVTFHKAFDKAPDYRQALEDVIATGAARILTSGGKTTAAEGIGILNEIIEQAAGRIKIVAAGKITSENIGELSLKINTYEFHGRKIV